MFGATLIGMTAMFFGLFSDENAHIVGIPRDIDEGFWDSLWWSLHQVIRLRAFEQMYGASAPILAYATFLSLMGLAVFGVLVSLINNAMRSRLDRLQQGDTPVKERGHVLVLGWNNRIISVLRQLAQLKPGVWGQWRRRCLRAILWDRRFWRGQRDGDGDDLDHGRLRRWHRRL